MPWILRSNLVMIHDSLFEHDRRLLYRVRGLLAIGGGLLAGAKRLVVRWVLAQGCAIVVNGLFLFGRLVDVHVDSVTGNVKSRLVQKRSS